MDLPTYKSHKTVQAVKIASIELRPADFHLLHPVIDLLSPVKVSDDYVNKHQPQPGGYFVQYEDGYQSYSPATAFESGYTQCDGPGVHETKTYADGTVASGTGPLPETSPTDSHFLQPKITGYRQLNPTEVALMNEGKALAEQVGTWIAKLRKHPNVVGPAPTGDALTALDQRWVSIGSTHLQEGFMAVTRGIARPTTF